jgi:hypothetical protein
MPALGHFRFVLHPTADPAAFEALLGSLDPSAVLQLTRVTSGFDARLLAVRRPDTEPASTFPPARYIWEVSVRTVNDLPYDFGQNAERVQALVTELATLTSVETLRVVAPTDA